MIGFFKNLFRGRLNSEKQALTESTLSWVNRMRYEYNLGPRLEDLPVGARGVASACPIAKALKVSGQIQPTVYKNFTFSMKNGETVSGKVPDYVVQWIRKFDDGHYHQYSR